MWITYSVNKEDMWVSRIPVPVRYRVDGPVADNFDNMDTGGHVTDWNIYSPLWAPVRVVDFPSAGSKSLELRDEDPHDYARAVRVFQEGTKPEISCRVLARQSDTGLLDIEVVDRYGNRPVRIRFCDDGRMRAVDGSGLVDLQAYKPNIWYKLDITVDATPFGHYDVSIDGRKVLANASLAEAVLSVERLSFRTGPYRDQPTRETDSDRPHEPLPGADESAPLAVFNVKDVRATTSR